MNTFLDNLAGYFDAGGFVMPALLGLSVVLWSMIFERWIYLFGSLPIVPGWRQGSRNWETGRFEAAVKRFVNEATPGAARELHEFCRATGGEMAGFVHRALLEHRVASAEDLALSLDESLAAFGRKVEKRIQIISVLSMLAPMLGLLGTVSGMIEAFETMTLAGAADAKALSGGISAALITTQVGLVVALPGLFSRSIFRRRAGKILDDMHLLAVRIRSLCTSALRTRTGGEEAGEC